MVWNGHQLLNYINNKHFITWNCLKEYKYNKKWYIVGKYGYKSIMSLSWVKNRLGLTVKRVKEKVFSNYRKISIYLF